MAASAVVSHTGQSVAQWEEEAALTVYGHQELDANDALGINDNIKIYVFILRACKQTLFSNAR